MESVSLFAPLAHRMYVESAPFEAYIVVDYLISLVNLLRTFLFISFLFIMLAYHARALCFGQLLKIHIFRLIHSFFVVAWHIIMSGK